MPDISDVTLALARLVAQAVYPNGEGQPSITGAAVKVYPGWPNEADLDKDLKAGKAHVSVFNLPKMAKDATKLNDGWDETAGPSPTYALAVLNRTITVTGAAPAPHHVHNVALAFDGPSPVLYSPPAGRTAAQVAADLAALIVAAGIACTVNGGDITIAAPHRISFARIGTIGSALHEVSRMVGGWQISIWAPSHDARTLLGKAIKPAVDVVPFLTFDNDASARIRPASAVDSDDAARPGAYLRHLIYTVEVPTTVRVDAPEIVAFGTTIENPAGEVLAQTLE